MHFEMYAKTYSYERLANFLAIHSSTILSAILGAIFILQNMYEAGMDKVRKAG